MRIGSRSFAIATIAVMGVAWGCDLSDTSDDERPCSRGTCGYLDYHYNSVFYCPPGPFVPGGWFGYTWHNSSDCHNECAAASSWDCYTSGCDTGCDTSSGSGAWLACTETNGGEVTDSGCFLSGSGVNGETVPCVCQ